MTSKNKVSTLKKEIRDLDAKLETLAPIVREYRKILERRWVKLLRLKSLGSSYSSAVYIPMRVKRNP